VLILDTNVYLDAARDRSLSERVDAYVGTRHLAVGLSSVVFAELLVGIAAPADRARFVRATIGATDPAHVLTPIHADWETAGDALARLGGDEATRGRSFWNDLLIAASCARAGATLVTRNADDFRRIRRVIPVTVEPRPA
jgi:predicted nucleic acid-binding protein